MVIEPLAGGVTAPRGFQAAGVASGIKSSGLDLALVVSDGSAAAAGVFTTSLAAAAPVILSRRHLQASGGRARGLVINSGCANACTGDAGMAVAQLMTDEGARVIGCATEEVLVASTGVIGVALDPDTVRAGITAASTVIARDAHAAAARAIMTTDPGPKECAVRVRTSAGSFAVGGMAKGAGMIEPNMATMLGFVTTDAQVPPAALHRALVEAVDETFNAITVDGECSTNDAVIALANGESGTVINEGDERDHAALVEGLRTVCHELALGIVRGGEGATKLIAVRVVGAATLADARRTARAIANSLLVKTAVHGGDPNWGRLVAVAGRAGTPFDLGRAVVRIGSTVLFADGRPYDDRSPEAARHLQGDSVELEVDVGQGGTAAATVWTCDLSAEYVRINAEYRT